MAVTASIDNGSPLVLVDKELVIMLELRKLSSLQQARLAMGDEEMVLTEWVKPELFYRDQQWTARVVRAAVAPMLAYPVLLGDQFSMEQDRHEFDRVTMKNGEYQLPPRQDVPAVQGFPDEQQALPPGDSQRQQSSLWMSYWSSGSVPRTGKAFWIGVGRRRPRTSIWRGN